MSADPVAELLSDPRFRGKPITWGVTSESYDAVRRAWLIHVHAEEVLFKPFTEDEFETQMEVMLSVFTDDCVMELSPAGLRWQGHAQATEFYRIFLAAFEGMKWVPQALVIGPQGVLRGGAWSADASNLEASHRGLLDPVQYHDSIGFRVASSQAVPEPSTLAIWSVLGCLGLVVAHRQRRRRAA